MTIDAPYLADRFRPARRPTLAVAVGDTTIGGNAPVLVQSMATTDTRDIAATARQVLQLARAGCELARITVQTAAHAACLREISKLVRQEGCQIPLCADVHFQPAAAFEALRWVEKVRVNPGNFVDPPSERSRVLTEADFARGRQRVFDGFSPLVREAQKLGRVLRIGVNHGSLSGRMLTLHGDTAEGMVAAAMEYLEVCEAENFRAVVFSMKASNPRMAVPAYRLLAQRLAAGGHEAYPFHIGITEAGAGEDGRLRSAAGIGALLLDGLGDTIRVSLTGDPVAEISVARDLLEACALSPSSLPPGPGPVEEVAWYSYQRRSCETIPVGGLILGGTEKIAVAADVTEASAGASGSRKAELACSPLDELQLDSLSALGSLDPASLPLAPKLWSLAPSGQPVVAYRYLAGWLAERGRRDAILLRFTTDGSPVADLRVAAQAGGLLADGIGDALLIHRPVGGGAGLAFDILQAAGARRSKTEFIACPGCGRTLFDIETVLADVQRETGHLTELAIAVMGCVVNGPGEMADADFGCMGGAPGKVNLYVGRECVQTGIPAARAGVEMAALIQANGRWRERDG